MNGQRRRWYFRCFEVHVAVFVIANIDQRAKQTKTTVTRRQCYIHSHVQVVFCCMFSWFWVRQFRLHSLYHLVVECPPQLWCVVTILMKPLVLVTNNKSDSNLSVCLPWSLRKYTEQTRAILLPFWCLCVSYLYQKVAKLRHMKVISRLWLERKRSVLCILSLVCAWYVYVAKMSDGKLIPNKTPDRRPQCNQLVIYVRIDRCCTSPPYSHQTWYDALSWT